MSATRQSVALESTLVLAIKAPALIASQVARCRPLPRTTPNVHDPHDLGGLIDCEEHAINVRTPAVVEDANWSVGVEALWRYPESMWELFQRENRSPEAVEPRCALAWPS